MCLCVYPRCKRKTALPIDTKIGTRILYDSCLACIDPEVKRSKVKVTRLHGYENRHGRMAASGVCWCCRRGTARRSVRGNHYCENCVSLRPFVLEIFFKGDRVLQKIGAVLRSLGKLRMPLIQASRLQAMDVSQSATSIADTAL